MCGRYVIISTPEAIRALFGYGEQPNFPPRYNVAPTQPIPVVRLARRQALVRADALGLAAVLGQGSEDVSAPDQCARRIGARQAGLPQRHAAAALPHSDRRLLRMAGSAPGPPKRPYFVRAKRGADGTAPPLAFAGLCETWTGPNGEELDTAAIITTTANRTLAPMHERMPVFVRRKRSTCGSTAPMSKPMSPRR